jgi:hypothetical protein
MNDQREEALRLAKEAGLEQGASGVFYSTRQDIERLIALARASAAPQEPVAKVVEQSNGFREITPLYSYLPPTGTLLYAAPQPQAAALQERLDAEIRQSSIDYDELLSQAAALQAELTEAKAQWAKWAGLYEHELDNCNKAESQAAAMAGLLEEIKGVLWAEYYADEIKKIDAALKGRNGQA